MRRVHTGLATFPLLSFGFRVFFLSGTEAG
jgi:hypothetical protein